MSAFEICITPTRNKNVRKAAKPTNTTENREPTIVTFGPFTGKSTVTFENIPITKTATRTLLIRNSRNAETKIMVTRILRPEYNITLEWTSKMMPPNGEVSMNMSWTPLKEFCCRETLQLTDNNNFRKDVTVVLKSINRSNTVKKSHKISNGRSVTTLKIRSPLSTRNFTGAVKRQTPAKKSPLSERNKTSYYPELPLNFDIPTKSSKKGKESLSPLPSPCNATALFDKINFEYLASLSTPSRRNGIDKSNIEIPNENLESYVKKNNIDCKSKEEEMFDTSRVTGRGEIIRSNKWRHDYSKRLKENETEYRGSSCNINNLEMGFLDEIQYEFNNHNYINSKTFELNGTKGGLNLLDDMCEVSTTSIRTEKVQLQQEQQQGQQQILMNQTETISFSVPITTLSTIKEEDKELGFSSISIETMEKTFDVENIQNNLQPVSVPLRKFSISMKDLSEKNSQTKRSMIASQGSMPNLSDIENLNSFTENRYYDKPKDLFSQTNCDDLSVTSATDVVFNQNEICAASSRFNVCDFGSSVKRSPKFVQLQNRFSPKTTTPVKPKRISLTPVEKHSKGFNTPSLTQSQHKRKLRRSLSDIRNQDDVNILSDKCDLVRPSISPPKRARLDHVLNHEINLRDSNFSSSNSHLARNRQWSKIKPKKTYVSRPTLNLALAKKSTTPSKNGKEEPRREILYNPEMYQIHVNPDPFAATTTCDPFIAATMYFDEKSVAKYEMRIKKWLNALVSIPAEFNSDYNKKIDVGHLFNEVCNKALTLVLTKEEQSMKYLTTSRMDALRAAAIELFQSLELTEPCCKIAIQINKQAIQIRKDKDLHLNVVLQREILELLLNFNPLWLRIGLEVVFGEKLPLQSNADIVGLSSFIIHRLFRDKYVEQKRSRAYTLTEEYSEMIKKSTLKKFLYLLLFLDKAKEKRIIKHNPCLFVKNSSYKETRDVLLRFSSELIASIGDITRVLKRYGYCLTHKQTFLDEFNYAFNNLAVDLRDGVRLTRVMEIILMRDDLTKQLRVPAISRLQRIYNVNLALKALSEADFCLCGDIAAADIVDGHREKTLSLLWQIIYKFRAPKFNAAASIIQRWWKKQWLKIFIERRIRTREERKRMKAATIIQSAYRGYRARKFVVEYRKERESAAICIQKNFRGYIVRKRYYYEYNCIRIIQRWYRSVKETKKIRQEYVKTLGSVNVIQRWFRRVVLAKKLEAAALHITELQMIARTRYESAVKIQKFFKSIVIRKRLQSLVYQIVEIQRQTNLENRSATKIQSYFLMITARKEFVLKKEATFKIQEYWRAYKAMKLLKAEYNTKKQATIKIQRFYRGYKEMKKQRTEFLRIRSAATVIQRRFRANKLCVCEKTKYQTIRNSAIKIQRWYRSILETRKIRKTFLNLKQTVIKMQQRFKATLEMRLVRSECEKYRKTVIFVQQTYRAKRAMEKQRNEYLKLKFAAITIQQRYRAYISMKEQRTEFLKLKYYTIVVQRKFRAILEMRKVKGEYDRFRQLVIFVQHSYRKKIVMKKERYNFLKLKAAAIVIQRWYRARISARNEKKKFVQIKNTVVGIQCYARGYLERKHFNEIMTPEMREQIKQTKAAINIQRHWRGYFVRKYNQNYKMKLIRSKINELKKDVKPQNTVSYRLDLSIKLLKGRFCVQEALNVLIRLEDISRTLPHLFLEYSDFLTTFCYGIMAQAIRSEIDKQVIELCSRVILNMARYNHTTATAFQECGLVTIAQMLLRWCDKECRIFNTLCTLIWVFGHYEDYKEKIRVFMTTHEALFMLRETKKLVLRKEKMKKNVRRPSFANFEMELSPNSLPSNKPDFGVVRNKPYIFISSVFAFQCVLDILCIDSI